MEFESTAELDIEALSKKMSKAKDISEVFNIMQKTLSKDNEPAYNTSKMTCEEKKRYIINFLK